MSPSDFSMERSIHILQRTPSVLSALARTGYHPDFGEVTLRQLLATWTSHDLAHIRQAARVMAKQYKEEVGPWKEFMPVMEE